MVLFSQNSKIQKYSPSESAKVYDKAINRKTGVHFHPKQTLDFLRSDMANSKITEDVKRSIVKQYLDVSSKTKIYFLLIMAFLYNILGGSQLSFLTWRVSFINYQDYIFFFGLVLRSYFTLLSHFIQLLHPNYFFLKTYQDYFFFFGLLLRSYFKLAFPFHPSNYCTLIIFS